MSAFIHMAILSLSFVFFMLAFFNIVESVKLKRGVVVGVAILLYGLTAISILV